MFRQRFALSAGLATVLAACASNGAPDSGVRQFDMGGALDMPLIIDVDGGSIDGGASGCTPACVGAEVCRAGLCVSATADADGDGVPTAEDCDDSTAGIGRLAERTCSSVCGVGVEQCSNGVWSPCTAPPACECVDGAPPRDVPCGFCGTQQQLCIAGEWMNAGACAGSGECMAGTVEPGGVCGRCGTAMRTCGIGCAWGAPVCTGEGECMAGMVETETQACGCGTQSRTRTCSGTCGWGAWGAFGACSGGGVCTPGATRAGSCDPCSQEVCTSSCTWGACSFRPGSTCDWESGTNWRSCSGGSCVSAPCWQYCSGTSCTYFPCQDM